MNLDKEYLSGLWDEITPKLYGYILHALRDRALADDILQAAWLKALEALPEFSGNRSNFSAWLFTIAKNEMRMHWRQSGREVPYDAEVHEPLAPDPGTEGRIFAEEIVRGLSEEDQELLRLRFIADLPIGEMARILGLNPVTLRVRMHRALNRARLALKKQIYE